MGPDRANTRGARVRLVGRIVVGPALRRPLRDDGHRSDRHRLPRVPARGPLLGGELPAAARRDGCGDGDLPRRPLPGGGRERTAGGSRPGRHPRLSPQRRPRRPAGPADGPAGLADPRDIVPPPGESRMTNRDGSTHIPAWRLRATYLILL